MRGVPQGRLTFSSKRESRFLSSHPTSTGKSSAECDWRENTAALAQIKQRVLTSASHFLHLQGEEVRVLVSGIRSLGTP